MNRRWKKLQRGKPKRQPRSYVLIVCEGRETEPVYFRSLKKHRRLSTADVEVLGRGRDPKAVVTLAERRAREKEREGNPYDQVWCVYDHDQHASLDEANDQAAALGFQVAWSNPCFELWFVLHFEDQTASCMARSLGRKLRANIRGYHKARDVYGTLEPLQPDAIRRCEMLRTANARLQEPKRNPSTNVDVLVVLLNRLTGPIC